MNTDLKINGSLMISVKTIHTENIKSWQQAVKESNESIKKKYKK